jgi:Ion channel
MAAMPAAAGHPATYRYGAVGVLTSVLVFFLILAPAADWSRSVALALEGAALIVALATSREVAAVRRARAVVVAIVATVVIIATATGLVSLAVAFALGGALAVAVPCTLVGGLIRLIRSAGVTVQAVAGALAIYLLVGVVFAWLVAFVAHVDSRPFFAHGEANAPTVYYSFTVLTTTGFGDYTAASPIGRALAVAEMLTGQLYLVTVIGLLVGSFSRGRSPDIGQER